MSTYVVKLGGHALDASSDANALVAALASDVAALLQQGDEVLLVHGGGPFIESELRRRGITSRFIEGLRVTTPEVLEAVVTALSVVNATLCARLGVTGLRVVGVNGASESFLRAEAAGGDLGSVGLAPKIDTASLSRLRAAGRVLVVSPIAIDDAGGYLNVNADAVAGALSAATQAERLLLLSDVEQVRTNPDDPATGQASLSAADVQNLLDSQSARDGMRPKLQAVLTALVAGAQRVVLANGARPHVVRDVLVGALPSTEVHL